MLHEDQTHEQHTDKHATPRAVSLEEQLAARFTRAPEGVARIADGPRDDEPLLCERCNTHVTTARLLGHPICHTCQQHPDVKLWFIVVPPKNLSFVHDPFERTAKANAAIEAESRYAKRYLEKHWRAHDLFMENHQTGKSTRLLWGEHTFRSGLTEQDFSKTSLKRAR